MKLSNKIGVMADNFNVGIYDGLRKAKQVGADGVQMYAGQDEMDPANLSNNKIKELKTYISSLGLEISALCGELGSHGLQDKSTNKVKIENLTRIMDLALALGTNVVTTHIGIIPDDSESEIYETMLQACEELAVYAHNSNAYFAVETGPETASHLKNFLDKLTSKGVSVNFDPANMVMVTGDDPVKGIKLLKEYIVHSHVKDGIRLREVDPRDIYGFLGYDKNEEKAMISIKEVPLGEGDVNFDAYFTAINDIGYKGYLTIECEMEQNPESAIEQAVRFLKKYK